MILRILWFAGVFGLSVWLGAHWDGSAAAVPPLDPAAVLPFDPAKIITSPFHRIWLVLTGGG
jgi:hypothetical protein